MKKYKIFYKMSALLLCFVMLLPLCSCSPSEPEKIEYKTALAVSSSFTGSRTFSATYPFSPDSDENEKLSRLVKNDCPSSLAYTYEKTDSCVTYTFTLSFSSFSDYISKLTDILGSRPTVTFSNPKTALTSGWRIEESFQSSQLLGWLGSAARAEQISDFDLPAEETSTTVTFDSETVSTLPAISVNKLTGTPIKSIKISTVNKKSTYDRTFIFTVSQTSFDSLGSKLSDYFASVTDESAQSDWQIENDSYTYTATFTDLTIKQLEGFTNRLLSSVYGDADYTDKITGSTPLASQNSFTETLDFSNYVSDNNSDVPIEYTYTTSDLSELDSCSIYSDFEWTNADTLTTDNNPGKTVGISVRQPSLTLRINDGKQYIPKMIDITLTPLDNENITKAFSFSYDISDLGYEASNYTASYFRDLGLNPTETSEGKLAVCSISFTGTPAELNSKIPNIFGQNNLMTLTSDVPFMTLRTVKHIEDKVDLTSILIGKNLETPVTYTLMPREGEIASSLTLTNDDTAEPAPADKNENGSYSILLAGSKAVLSSDLSVANVSDIIFFCVVSLIIILIAIALIFFLRSRKPEQTALPTGNKGNTPLKKSTPKSKLPHKSL